jgi:Holliday junction resolvase RusA-like endonuclease
MRVELFIPGRPRPKQRPRVGKGGRVYTPRATKNWEATVGWEWFINVGPRRFEGPIKVDLTFNYPDRRSVDVDNLIKAVLDGLEGVAYQNDSQIVEVIGRKLICPSKPGVQIVIDDALAVLGLEEA